MQVEWLSGGRRRSKRKKRRKVTVRLHRWRILTNRNAEDDKMTSEGTWEEAAGREMNNFSEAGLCGLVAPCPPPPPPPLHTFVCKPPLTSAVIFQNLRLQIQFLCNCFDAAALHPLIRPLGTWEDRFPAPLRKNKRGTSWEIIGEHGLGTPDFFFSLRKGINSLKITTNDADNGPDVKKVRERPRPAGRRRGSPNNQNSMSTYLSSRRGEAEPPCRTLQELRGVGQKKEKSYGERAAFMAGSAESLFCILLTSPTFKIFSWQSNIPPSISCAAPPERVVCPTPSGLQLPPRM